MNGNLYGTISKEILQQDALNMQRHHHARRVIVNGSFKINE